MEENQVMFFFILLKSYIFFSFKLILWGWQDAPYTSIKKRSSILSIYYERNTLGFCVYEQANGLQIPCPLSMIFLIGKQLFALSPNMFTFWRCLRTGLGFVCRSYIVGFASRSRCTGMGGICCGEIMVDEPSRILPGRGSGQGVWYSAACTVPLANNFLSPSEIVLFGMALSSVL